MTQINWSKSHRRAQQHKDILATYRKGGKRKAPFLFKRPKQAFGNTPEALRHQGRVTKRPITVPRLSFQLPKWGVFE